MCLFDESILIFNDEEMIVARLLPSG